MSQLHEQLGQPHDVAMEELAVAYALDVIDEGDRHVFRAHLAECPQCAALVRDYRSVSTMLPLSVDELEASRELRDRILSSIESDRSPAAPLPIRRSRRFSLSALAAAALLIVSLGFGYWNVRLQSELRQVQQSAQLEQEFAAALAAGASRHGLDGTAAAPQAHGAVVTDPSGGQPFLVVGGLPGLPADQAYQAWVVGSSGPVDAGVLPPGSGGSQLTRLNETPRPGETVALTVEPAGGAPAPTGQIVLAGVI